MKNDSGRSRAALKTSLAFVAGLALSPIVGWTADNGHIGGSVGVLDFTGVARTFATFVTTQFGEMAYRVGKSPSGEATAILTDEEGYPICRVLYSTPPRSLICTDPAGCLVPQNGDR